MKKPKEDRPAFPEVNIGKTLNAFVIDMRILELRRTIRKLEERIAELQALKDAPVDREMPNLDD